MAPESTATGSGKELIAGAIHEVSGLSGEFVAVNISGLDERFTLRHPVWHAKGAYTGADAVMAGWLWKKGPKILSTIPTSGGVPGSIVKSQIVTDACNRYH